MHRTSIWFWAVLALTATAYRQPTYRESGVSRYATVSNEFGYRLQRAQSYRSGNQLISPYGISKVLSVLYEGTGGRTQQQLGHLGYRVLEQQGIDISQSYQQLHRYLQTDSEESQLEEATALLYPSDYSVSPQYQQLLESSYQSLVQQVDDRQGNGDVAQEVNRWIQEQTRGKISQIVDKVDASSGLVLLNGVYYQGSIQPQSEQDQVQQGSFYNEGETSSQSALYYQTRSRYPYYQDEQLQAVQLPYQDDEYTLLVLLPSRQSDVRQVQHQVSSRVIQRLITRSQETQLQVSIPQFSLDYSQQLQQDVQSLGITSVFGTGADLSGISSSGRGYVSQIIQRAVVELGKYGAGQQDQYKSGQEGQYEGEQHGQYGAGQEGQNGAGQQGQYGGEQGKYRAGQQGQYGGEQGQYGAGQRGQYGGEQGQYGAGQWGQYGDEEGQYGDGQQGQYGGEQSQYGARQQGQYGGEQGQYGSRQQGQYGGEQGQYGAGQQGQYGGEQGQYGAGRQGQYGGEQGQYGAGRQGQYGNEQDQYGAGQQGQYGGEQGQYGAGQQDQYGDEQGQHGSGQQDQIVARQEGQYGGVQQDEYGVEQLRQYGARQESNVEFWANRPFLFYVIHKPTGLNLLAGRISQL